MTLFLSHRIAHRFGERAGAALITILLFAGSPWTAPAPSVLLYATLFGAHDTAVVHTDDSSAAIRSESFSIVIWLLSAFATW